MLHYLYLDYGGLPQYRRELKYSLISLRQDLGAAPDAKIAVFFPIYAKGELVTDPAYYVKSVKTLGIIGSVIAREPKRDLAAIRHESARTDNSPRRELITLPCT